MRRAQPRARALVLGPLRLESPPPRRLLGGDGEVPRLDGALLDPSELLLLRVLERRKLVRVPLAQRAHFSLALPLGPFELRLHRRLLPGHGVANGRLDQLVALREGLLAASLERRPLAVVPLLRGLHRCLVLARDPLEMLEVADLELRQRELLDLAGARVLLPLALGALLRMAEHRLEALPELLALGDCALGLGLGVLGAAAQLLGAFDGEVALVHQR